MMSTASNFISSITNQTILSSSSDSSPNSNLVIYWVTISGAVLFGIVYFAVIFWVFNTEQNYKRHLKARITHRVFGAPSQKYYVYDSNECKLKPVNGIQMAPTRESKRHNHGKIRKGEEYDLTVDDYETQQSY